MSWDGLQREYYEGHVGDYERRRATRVRAYLRKARLLEEALPRSAEALLEVGAGSGLVTRHLAARLAVRRYVALDFSLSMIETARSRNAHSSVRFVIGDAGATGLEDEQFDAVVGVDILHHLDDPVQALQEWRRVTRRGGSLAVLETNAWNPATLMVLPDRHERRVFRNSRLRLAGWARRSGWDAVCVRPTPCFTPSGRPGWGDFLDAID